MTDKQLAEKEAEKYAEKFKVLNSEQMAFNSYIAGINSKSVELKVVEGGIKLLEEQLGFNYTLVRHNQDAPYGKDFCSAIHVVNAKLLFEKTKLETQREAIINEINKGE